MRSRSVGFALLASFLLLLEQPERVDAGQNTPPPGPAQSNDTASHPAPEAPPPITCPAGAPIGAVDLRVRSAKGGDPLPFRTINHLSEGDTVLYAPILRGREKRPGEISLVMVPAKREPDKDALIISDPKPAEKPQDWKMTETISLAVLVYGPEGLSKKKVKGFLSQDELLIAQLADYAERTAQTEALVQALSSIDSSPESVNAALTGFASQYGFSVQLDRTAPPAVQAQTLFATMNPQIAAYDPLTPSTAAKIGQTASVATVAATFFFGSPIGLAAGGTAMLLDLRAIAFPGTQFRSSFAQTVPNSSGLNLCGQRTPAPPHTRVAYLWANRIPNVDAPSIRIGEAAFIPPAQKTPVPVTVPDPQWKYLERARSWALENEKHQRTPVTVLKLANQKALELDLTKANLAPGAYRLDAFWDWSPFQGAGDLHVEPLSDFTQAKLDAASQDRLIARTGKIPVTLTGSDFEFTTKVELKKSGDEFATAQSARFILPKGLREGPQDHLDVQIDTAELTPGDYALLISQQDGKSHPVNIKILQPVAKIDNLPMVANQGVAVQHYVLKGERLNLLAKLEAPGVAFDLGPPALNDSERNVTVQLKSNPAPGTELAVKAYLVDRNETLDLPDGLQITGPLPLIASSKLSLPAGMAIAIKPGEFPAGYTLSAMLDVKNIAPRSVLRLGCSDDTGTQLSLHIGQQTETASLEQLPPDQLFLSVDTSAWPAGCSIQAVIDNGNAGRSQPFTLGNMIRLPQIEDFKLTSEQPSPGSHTGILTGRNLEMIEKVGWDQLTGTPVPGLPVPIPGQGQKQSLQVNMPDPPTPQTPLVIWLRGEKTGRATSITNSAPPLNPPQQTPAPGVNSPQQPNPPPQPQPNSDTQTPVTPASPTKPPLID
ncbi:MAG: hypothetical protein JOY62_19530 [Acidobacteriaceae bacterium]|nr:hypothetical protein [Acidobacteriaceae bacterium]MBV9782159.1 hypothetical protein [Acidobacteriaceae bacterium]